MIGEDYDASLAVNGWPRITSATMMLERYGLGAHELFEVRASRNEENVRKRNLEHFLAKPRGRLENTTTNMTFSMTRETAVRLKDAAVARGINMQGVIELAVNEWLARQTPISAP